MVVWVLALGQHVLVASVVGLLVGHPATAVHADGVTAGEVSVCVGAVAAALIVAAFKVPALVEDYLNQRQLCYWKTREAVLTVNNTVQPGFVGAMPT